MLVDDLRGTAHQVYGGLADPTYLIDADGRVAYYQLWTGAPSLHRALEALLAQGGRGVVRGGLERRPHLGPSLTDGWRAIARGLPQSFTDLMVSAPGVPVALWLGEKVGPALRPLTLRARPLPAPVRAALAIGALGLAGALVRRALRARAGGPPRALC